MVGIYQIKNKLNDKVYVGKSVNIPRRWNKHISDFNLNKYPKILIYKAFNKYGLDNFEFSILELCEEKDLIEKEISWIEKLKSKELGYNMTLGGESNLGSCNPFYGKTHSEDTKEHLSKLAKERTGIKNPFYGKQHTEETKKLLAENKGKPVKNSKGQEFKNAKQAGSWCKELGLTKSKSPNSDILKACKSGKKAFGLYWYYI